jgi:type I restriction enzyme S subunit
MVAITRISPEFLLDRLDGRYNSPLAVSVRKKINASGLSTKKITDVFALICGPFGSTLTADEHAENGEVLLIQPTNISGDTFSEDSSWRITKKDQIAKGLKLYPPGTLLFARVGVYPHTGILPIESGLATISSSMIAGLPKNDVDTHYICAFFKSSHGFQLLLAAQKVTAQPTIGTSEIGGTEIPVPEQRVQQYIGDKVRQAERLRAWATILEQRVNTLFQADFKWDFSVLKVSPFNRVRADELENRLDLKFNSPHRLAAIRHAKSVNANLVQLDQIVEISAMIGWKGLTTEHYTTSGPWLLRGVEFSKGVIRTEDLVCVDEDKYLEQPQIHLSEGDIALTKDGTIGKALVIPRLPNRIAAGSTVARLRKKSTSNIDPYYLEFALAHEFVQCQIESFATGVAQPHITQEWIALLKIPRITSEELIAETWKTHHDCLNVAKQLTTAAKHLVEALIEGQLSEGELIVAEQALQAGNDQSDRRILNRLKTDGINGKGQPLFSDLDQLYSLVEQASHS